MLTRIMLLLTLIVLSASSFAETSTPTTRKRRLIKAIYTHARGNESFPYAKQVLEELSELNDVSETQITTITWLAAKTRLPNTFDEQKVMFAVLRSLNMNVHHFKLLKILLDRAEGEVDSNGLDETHIAENMLYYNIDAELASEIEDVIRSAEIENGALEQTVISGLLSTENTSGNY